MPVEAKDLVNLSAPAILIVWTLREVFSYLLKMQSAKKEDSFNPTESLLPIMQSLSERIEKQNEILQKIYMELRENSVHLNLLSKKSG